MSAILGKFGPEFLKVSQLNQNNGVAGLDGSGKIPSSLLPSIDMVGGLEYKGTHNATTPYPASGDTGDFYVVNTAGDIDGEHYNVGDMFFYNGTGWDPIHSPVNSDHLAEGTEHLYFSEERALAAAQPQIDTKADLIWVNQRLTEKVDLNAFNDLSTAVDGKADAVHTHVVGDVTGLQDALDSKAAASHTHSIDQVDGLQAALDSVSDAVAAQAGTRAKEKFVLAAGDISNGYIQLSNLALPNSVIASVKGLGIINEGAANDADADYVLSTQGAQTRLTWTNDLAGSTALEAGDVIFVQYVH